MNKSMKLVLLLWIIAVVTLLIPVNVFAESDPKCGAGTVFDAKTNSCILSGTTSTKDPPMVTESDADSKCGAGTVFDSLTNSCILGSTQSPENPLTQSKILQKEYVSILNLQNNGDRTIKIVRIWLDNDVDFYSFFSDQKSDVVKTEQKILVFNLDTGLQTNDSIKFGLITNEVNPDLFWRVEDSKGGFIEYGDYRSSVPILKESQEYSEMNSFINKIPSFVDPKEEPEYYVDRYNNDENYRNWFDENYLEFTIYGAVGFKDSESFENHLNKIKEEKSKLQEQIIQNQFNIIKQDFEKRTIQLFISMPKESDLLELVGKEKKVKYEKLQMDLKSRGIQYQNIETLLSSGQITSNERILLLELLEDIVSISKIIVKNKIIEFDEFIESFIQEIDEGDLSKADKERLIKDIKFEAEIKKNQMLVVFANTIQPLENILNKEQSKQEIIKEISDNSQSGGGCLIATATYGSELAPQVQQLRELRDNQLLQTEAGTAFMKSFNDFYYSFSPVIADYERENPVFREMVKVAITPMISSLSLMEYADSESAVLGIGISLIVLNLMMYVGIPVIVIVRVRK